VLALRSSADPHRLGVIMSFRLFEVRSRATPGRRAGCWGDRYGVSGLVRRRHIMARRPALRRADPARQNSHKGRNSASRNRKRPRSPLAGLTVIRWKRMSPLASRSRRMIAVSLAALSASETRRWSAASLLGNSMIAFQAEQAPLHRRRSVPRARLPRHWRNSSRRRDSGL